MARHSRAVLTPGVCPLVLCPESASVLSGVSSDVVRGGPTAAHSVPLHRPRTRSARRPAIWCAREYSHSHSQRATIHAR